MISRKSLALCIGFCLCSSITLADVNANDIKPGDAISGVITFVKKTVPLPEGEWIVAEKKQSAVGQKDAESGLINESESGTATILKLYTLKEGAVHRVMLLNVLVYPHSRGQWKESKACEKQEAAYYWTDFSSGYDSPECMAIDMSFGLLLHREKPDVFSDWGDQLREKQIRIPVSTPTVIYNNFYASGRISAIFIFNPELDGVPAASTYNWQESEWNPAHLGEPNKRYIANLQSWSKQMSDTLRRSVDFTQTKPLADLPPL